MLRNLHSIDPAHAVYDAHPLRCTSHSMRRADPAKGFARKCDRSKVAGCLGCELGLKELKPRQLYERLLRQLRAVVFDGVKTSRMLSCHG